MSERERSERAELLADPRGVELYRLNPQVNDDTFSIKFLRLVRDGVIWPKDPNAPAEQVAPAPSPAAVAAEARPTVTRVATGYLIGGPIGALVGSKFTKKRKS